MANKATRIGSRKSSPKPTAPSIAKSMVKEMDYQAEDDARTIARAAAIKFDPDRLQKAAKAAARLADEKAAELRGLRSISRRAR